MRIRFTPSANAQLKSAIAFTRRDRPSAVTAFSKKAKQRLLRLTEFPKSGRKVPEYPVSGVREVIISPYRFFYQERETGIWILAVWHEAQLPEDPNASKSR